MFQLLDLLRQLTAVLMWLDQKWTYALLRRTRAANRQLRVTGCPDRERTTKPAVCPVLRPVFHDLQFAA